MKNEEELKKSKNLFDLYETWSRELENSEKYEKSWKDEAVRYENTYKDQSSSQGSHNGEVCGNTYNIFYANTETLAPLVYSRLPNPNITRRFADDDEIARLCSEMMERAIDFCLDVGKTDTIFSKARKDYLITGRGLVRAFLKEGDVIETEEGEEEYDPANKLVGLEYVSWRNFITSTEANWSDIRWIAFRHYKTREELTEMFGKRKAENIPLNSTNLSFLKDKADFKEDINDLAEIYEIWDKVNKKVIWLSYNNDGKVIQVEDDPYNLQEFFPVARPVGSDTDPASILPIPLYRMYRVQAEDLEIIDNRIRSLTEQLKYTGVYSTIAEGSNIENLMGGDDGEFNPLSNVQGLGDLNKQIVVKDIVPIANVIAQLNQQKALVINNIREITGLSDIVRGVSVASETATAQRLKGDFAISRIQPLQKAFEIMIRDSIEIMSELLVENYSITELAQMTNLKIVDIETIAQAANDNLNNLLQEGINNLPANISPEEKQQQIQQLEATAKQGFNKTLSAPKQQLKGYAATPEQVKEMEELLQNDKLRTFSIDVETDSTVSVDQQKEKQDRIEFIAALTNFSSQFFPLVQAGVVQPETFNEFLGYMARPFKVGRNLEESLLSKPDEAQEQEEQQPSIEEQIALADSQRKDQELQLKAQDMQVKADQEQQKINIEKAKVKQGQLQFEERVEFEDANKAADRQKDLLMKASDTAQEVVESRTERVGNIIRNA